MKIVLLSAGSSIHTIRWANGLSDAGLDIHLITQHAPQEPLNSNVTLHLVPNRGMLGYFLMVPAVKKIIREIQPDLVNAHYASGYATTATFLNFHPWILSVWGSDVYSFPYKSKLHKRWVVRNLKSADTIASTSYAMAKQTQLVEPLIKEITITPFGVDLSLYKSLKPVASTNDVDEIVIGTVKTMSNTYGIDLLIKSFAKLKLKIEEKAPQLAKKLKLRLVGGGDQLEEYQQLAKRLNISEYTCFVGRVAHETVPLELEKLDIYVALSRVESFGVAIIEAGAAQRCVVVSNVGGLPEVVVHGETGIVVPSEDIEAATEALEKLVLNPELRAIMGIKAKQYVAQEYSWAVSIQKMKDLYKNTIAKSRGKQ